MTFVGKVVVLCVIFVSQTHGTTIPSLRSPIAYFEAVTARLWERIQKYGVSNLPVDDFATVYNTTSLGIELRGPVSFEDGFVVDIADVTANPQRHSSTTAATSSAVTGQIQFHNLQVMQDFRADFSTGTVLGSTILVPRALEYDIRIEKGYDNDTVVPLLSFASLSTLDWHTHPDTTMTRLIRRQYSVAVLTSNSALVTSSVRAWIPIFQNLLNEATMEVPYPELVF